MNQTLQSLLPVRPKTIGVETVNAIDARMLHAFLQVGTPFHIWVLRRIEDFGFQERLDFEVLNISDQNPLGGRPSRDYALSLSMAKELAMVERNDRGKQARLYFIDCERRAQEKAWDIPKTYAGALALAARQAERLEVQAEEIAVLEPKAAFADRVAEAEGSHTIAEAAKILGTGQNRLFALLRAWGYLIPGQTLPYQQYVDNGTFRVVELAFEDRNKVDRLASKTLLTGKGMVAVQRRLAAEAPGALIRPQHQGKGSIQ